METKDGLRELHGSREVGESIFLCGSERYSAFNMPRMSRDFPGGPVVKNPPSNAGDVGSIPGQGTKIPHATGQLSLSATTTELTCLNERARVPPMRPGARVPQLERENLHATTREKPACHNEEPTPQ